MTAEPARVLIVDDHPIVRQGLIQLIDRESDLAVCGEAADAEAALAATSELSPHVVVLDLMLKGESSGTELLKTLRARHEKLPILIVSMYDELVYAERSIRAGADGFIMKEAATSQVITALRKVLRGDVYVSERMISRILRRMRHGPARPGIEQLSDRELEVFEWIGRGLTIQQTAERIEVSPKTVETYRANIKSKLGLTSSTEVVRLALQWFEQRSAEPEDK